MVTTSVLALLGLGAGAAILLAVASRLLRVEENPAVELIVEALPGANCGGCGFAGCEAYALAVVANHDIPANLCSVGGAEVAARVGELSGKAVLAGESMVAFRSCSRVEGKVRPRFEYIGIPTCASAAMLEGGPYMCSWACLGLGDCVRACPFDAMHIVDGLVEISPSRCMSCGQCVNACPRGIPRLIPRRARVMIHCSTRDAMKAVSEVCAAGCINCLKCVKACPAGAVRREENRIEIDHELCLRYGPACDEVCVSDCPRGIMRRHAPAPGILLPAPDLSGADAAPDCASCPANEDGASWETAAPACAPCSADEDAAPTCARSADMPGPEIIPVVSPSGKTPAPTVAESMSESEGRGAPGNAKAMPENRKEDKESEP